MSKGVMTSVVLLESPGRLAVADGVNLVEACMIIRGWSPRRGPTNAHFSGAQAMVALAILHQINTDPKVFTSTPAGRV